jgi:putative copper export protein
VLLAGLAVAALLLLGWAQITAFRDPFAPWSEDAGLLLASDWGVRWRWAVAGASAILVAFALRPLRPLAYGIAPLLAAYPAFSGHAAASGSWAPLAMTADWLHVVAAGTWIGSLALLVLTLSPARAGASTSPDFGESTPRPLLLEHLSRFSNVARWSVATLLLTGGLASWLHLPDPMALWAHPYGRILALKLFLVGGLLSMGAWNWKVLTPAAHSPEGADRLLRSARLEALVGVVVMVITGWLTGTAPPA